MEDQNHLRELVKSAMEHAPHTQSGIPAHVYRPDLLPRYHQSTDTSMVPVAWSEKDLQAAKVDIELHEGYPRLNGIPIWQRLPWEDSDAFSLFTTYLEMGMEKVRKLADVPQHHQLPNPYLTEPTLDQLRYLETVYYWQPRTTAYDQNFKREWHTRQEQAFYEFLARHQTHVQQLYGKIQEHMANEDLFWRRLTPRNAIDLFKILSEMQHINTQTHQTEKLEKITEIEDESDAKELLETLLKDEDALRNAQNVLISVTKQQNDENDENNDQ